MLLERLLPPTPTLVAATAALAAAGAAHLALAWTARRHVGAALATPLAEVARALRGPATLLIWTAGLSIAVTLLVPSRLVEWTRGPALVAVLVWLMSRLGRVVEAVIAPWASRTDRGWDDVVTPIVGRAARLLLPLLALMLGVPAVSVPAGYDAVVRNGVSLVLIAAVSFVLFQVVDAAAALVLRRYRIDASDNLQARSVCTQVTVLRKIASVVIALFTLASMLMVFEPVRQLGTSILASAGIAGIIVGFAAQRSIATLLAGLQIAITQPIRLDDVVIVENEWGRIEAITLTYVTVRIWDQRRLIVPITHFIEQPFQNWTRASAEILGTVFLHVDYRAPLAAIREELDRVLADSPYWDGKVKGLQVTDARERTIELRALASAADASLAWDLRCEIRERLIAFLQQHHPDSLPRVRAELAEAPAVARIPGGALSG
jgi:small-conductance mechanosensitive channel